MAALGFHDKAFDEGTLTKLELFQLYTREWLPVFLAREEHAPAALHLFDFFAGPGTDAAGVLGSPLRTLETLKEYANSGFAGWKRTKIVCHFFDASARKVDALTHMAASRCHGIENVSLDIQQLEFEKSFARYAQTLEDRAVAKLLLIDQFGVDSVTPEVFRRLIGFPRTDFLFFISSNTLHRFREHPAIKQRITPAADYYHVHRAVFDYYRQLIPHGTRYYLAPFSIKKGSNIYGLIFGSAHPLGMDKFLSVAWRKDRTNGEADFDINRDHLTESEYFDLDGMFRPRKVSAFESALESALRGKSARDEWAILELCFEHGVTRQHAKPVLQRLVDAKILEADFRVPDVKNIRAPRAVRFL